MNILQRLRESFWFIPAVMCVAAVGVAEALVALDRHRETRLVPDWAAMVFLRVGASGSRDILGTIAASSLAVAGTTFSITMAVLALTSSSYGPRLVRNFMADRGNQTVLGIYVSTFLYSLIVLRSVRVLGDPGEPEGEVFVPHLAVNAAVLLAVVNVAVLIYFIHHISDSIQVATLASDVRADLLRTVDRLYPADVGHRKGAAGGDGPGRDADEVPPHVLTDGVPVTAGRCGYLQFLHDDDLMSTARKHDVLLVLRVRPGQYVLDDTVAVLVHPPERAGDEVLEAVRSTLGVADARTPHQDPEFAVQQLTEMAVRALSPSVNDPYTAMNALDDLSVGLARVAERPRPSAMRADEDGVPRVHAVGVGAETLVTSVVDSMRWYAASSPAVMQATLVLVERVGLHARAGELRATLLGQIDLLDAAFSSAGHHSHDLRTFRERAGKVRDRIAAA